MQKKAGNGRAQTSGCCLCFTRATAIPMCICAAICVNTEARSNPGKTQAKPSSKERGGPAGRRNIERLSSLSSPLGSHHTTIHM